MILRTKTLVFKDGLIFGWVVRSINFVNYIELKLVFRSVLCQFGTYTVSRVRLRAEYQWECTNAINIIINDDFESHERSIPEETHVFLTSVESAKTRIIMNAIRLPTRNVVALVVKKSYCVIRIGMLGVEISLHYLLRVFLSPMIINLVRLIVIFE